MPKFQAAMPFTFQVDDKLVHRLLGKTAVNPYPIVQHPKTHGGLRLRLKFQMQHQVFRLLQN
ncbi:hypothetical protein AOY38_14155 [Synechocystis sp. PCC 6803]|nr:hypothetical protein AOY38_14155 [Synechocystis sp. PCC 6803]